MKIILISFSTRGAIGDYLFLLTKELAKKTNITLIVPNYFNKNIENVEIVHFKTGRNKFLTFFQLVNPLNFLQIINTIKNSHPSVVHLFFGEGYPMAIFLSFYLKIIKTPLIITVHDPEIHPGNLIDKINGILRKITFKLSSGIHIHSKLFVDQIKKQVCKKNKIFIINHGSFASLFKEYKSLFSIKKEDAILFFGRIEEYKGLDILVSAGLKLNGEFKIIIAGPGNLNRKLKETIKESSFFELHNRYLSEKEIAILFQRVRVCVLPYTQATQSSLPLISAFFNVPVVSSDIGGLSEDVLRINGVLVEPKNVDSLIQGIREAVKKNSVYPNELDFSFLAPSFLEMYQYFR